MSPLKNTNAFLSLYNLLVVLPDAHYPTFLVGFFSLAVIFALKLHPRTKRLPGPLVSVVLSVIVMVIWTKAISKEGPLITGLPCRSLLVCVCVSPSLPLPVLTENSRPVALAR